MKTKILIVCLALVACGGGAGGSSESEADLGTNDDGANSTELVYYDTFNLDNSLLPRSPFEGPCTPSDLEFNVLSAYVDAGMTRFKLVGGQGNLYAEGPLTESMAYFFNTSDGGECFIRFVDDFYDYLHQECAWEEGSCSTEWR